MKAHKRTISINCILVIGAFLFAPYIYSQSFLSFDSISARVQRQRELSPQEKIYVHTDKPHYVCGEKIWFRAYLLDAFTHLQVDASKFVYVELISPTNHVASRVKIKSHEDAFSGYVQLGDSLAEGNYTLCAYTSLMCGSSPEYFFKKNIYISNPIQKSMRADAEFEKDGNRIKTQLYFTDLFKNKRIQPYRIYVTLDQDTIDFKWNDKDSLYQASFRASDKGKILTVRSGNFRQYIPIPDFEKDFDVSFFPEGGYLIPDKLCRVGFKTLASDGWSAEIKGELYDNDNQLICNFSPYYKGMGDFYFRPQTGKEYYTICKDTEGQSKRFELPQVNPNACILQVVQDRKEITVGIQYTKKPLQLDDYTLIVHSRGEIYYTAKWNKKKDYIRFKKKIFPSGIIQFLLLDDNGNPLSERLMFCKNDDQAETTITTDKKEYGTRELVTVKVKVQDKDNKPVTGNFSVSVTDNGVVREDTCTSIYSSLLLSSELRGNIESPAFYFKKDNRLASTALDALMLTQGWRRYDLPEVIKGHYTESESILEIGQEISGTVLSNLRHKPVTGSQVAMASLDKQFADVIMTDSKGRFSFNGFEFQDSTSFYIRALSKKGSEYVELKMDEDIFPHITSAFIKKDWFSSSLDDYTNKTANKISMENGMKHIWLDEVVKTAPKKLPPVKELLASHTYSQEYIKERNITSLIELLRRVPGLKISNIVTTIKEDGKSQNKLLEGVKFEHAPLFRETIYFAAAQCPVLIVIDNVAMNDPYFIKEEFDYSSIIFMDVDHVNIYRPGQSAIFGFKGAGGVIDITTKRGQSYEETNTMRNAKVFNPLGYQKNLKFYSPSYVTTEQKNAKNIDLRTTIYWNPNIKLSASGEVAFDFYSADFDTEYSIKLEGVNNGYIEKQEIVIEIKNEE